MGERLGIRVERLARWWTSATQEARFALLKRVLEDKAPAKEAPTLREVQLAILLAETEAGEVSQG